MSVQSLGYLGVRAKYSRRLGRLRQKMLGLQRIDKSRARWRSAWTTASSASSSMPTAAQGIELFRLGGGGRCRARCYRRAAGKGRRHGGARLAALADERRVKDLIVTNDPVGNRLELFHGAETTADPFRPGRSISGFRTGPLGLGQW